MHCAAFVNRYAVAPGRNVVILTTGASAYRAAIDLASAGIDVQIIDSRSAEQCGGERQAAETAGIRVRNGYHAVCCKGPPQAQWHRHCADRDGSGTSGTEFIACDCIGMSGGMDAGRAHVLAVSR